MPIHLLLETFLRIVTSVQLGALDPCMEASHSVMDSLAFLQMTSSREAAEPNEEDEDGALYSKEGLEESESAPIWSRGRLQLSIQQYSVRIASGIESHLKMESSRSSLRLKT